MKISLSKEETEEIIISLLYTNFIKNQVKIEDNPTPLLKHILQQAYDFGYTDLVTKRNDSVFIIDSVFIKAVYLLALQNGERTDNIPEVLGETFKELRKMKDN